MEMKDTNLYPEIPTAPPLEDEGQGYRLQKINEIQNFLESKVEKRESLSKKYYRASKIVDNIDTVLVFITTAGGIGGIGLLMTVVALPAVITLEGISGFCGLLSLVGKYVVNNSRSKAEKHEKVKIIASTKLNTITTHVSKALSDNKVTDEEFRLIMEELEKYKNMKEDIRSKSKKGVLSKTEELLIERGRREQRESFRKLVEKKKKLIVRKLKLLKLNLRVVLLTKLDKKLRYKLRFFN